MAPHKKTGAAAVYDIDGNALAEGPQGCYVSDDAVEAAQRIADREGCDVILGDDDAKWIVHPMIDGVRAPADLYKGTI